jgi:hypothetical protein
MSENDQGKLCAVPTVFKSALAAWVLSLLPLMMLTTFCASALNLAESRLTLRKQRHR